MKVKMLTKKISASLLALSMTAVLGLGYGNHISAESEESSNAESSDVTELTEEGQESSENSSQEASSAASEEAVVEETDEDINPNGINIAMLKGPTAMGAANLMVKERAKSTERDYNFTLMSSPNELVPRFIKGQFQMAAVPANLASTLYNKTQGNVQVLAINTLGVLYIVHNGDSDVSSFKDLDNKTIYASGQGASPEAALNFLAEKNGIKLNIEWKSEHSECLAAMAQEEGSFALLPQPFVTVAQTKNENIKTVLDLNKEWENAVEDKSALVTGVLIADKKFVQENKEKVDQFLKEYEESIKLTEKNIDESAANIAAFNIVPEPIAKKALPFCNIHFIAGQELKDKLSAYLELLKEQNDKLIGGEVPADNFYYEYGSEDTSSSEDGSSNESESESEETEESTSLAA